VRKEETGVLVRNGGMHRQKQYRQIKAMLEGHGYKRPRLYHLVMMDAIGADGAGPYLNAIKALCLHLRSFDIPTRWRAALERDDEKGLHMHVFMLVDATAHDAGLIINPYKGTSSAKNRTRKGEKRKLAPGWLRDMLARRGITLYLSQPKAEMHRVGGTAEGKRKNYASIAGDKLADCQEWLSYLVKARSKPEDIRGIYFSSRDSLHAPHIGPAEAEADPAANGQTDLQAA
jgi:hypothetical protein